VPLGNKSPIVTGWRSEADFDMWKQRPLPYLSGPFFVHIVWPIEDYTHYDSDNRVKILLDYLEKKVFPNDRNCVGHTAEFAGVEKGRCRIELWSVPDPRGED
jgi:Holliday junction resolvase RusA-like endonuclease